MAEPSSKQRISAESEHIIGGRAATVRPYSEQTEMKDSLSENSLLKRKIFVGGVNPALGQEVLENYFGKYGPLEDAQIMRYPDGRSRGFGFVLFREEPPCQQVLAQRNHHITPRDRVEVKPCLSRHKASRQTAQAYGPPPGAYGGAPGMYDGYGYGAAAYGGYGQQYGGYGGYGAPPPGAWQQEYQAAEATPWAGQAASGYDAYQQAAYYGWGGYGQGAPSAAPYGVAAPGGPRSSAPGASAVTAGSPGSVGRDQYYDASAATTAAAARGMASAPYSASPAGAMRGRGITSAPPSNPATIAAPAQMPGAYNPVRRAAGPVGYGVGPVRRPGPY